MSSCLPQATWTSSTCTVDVTLHCLVAVSAIGTGKSDGRLPRDVQQTLCVLWDASSDAEAGKGDPVGNSVRRRRSSFL